MIRTGLVELSAMAGFACRVKKGDGFVIRVISYGEGAYADARLDRETWGLIPVGEVDQSVFTPGVFEEALALTLGMPYWDRSLPGTQESPDGTCPLVESRCYRLLMRAYLDDTGRWDFALLRGDLDRTGEESPLAALQKLVLSFCGETLPHRDCAVLAGLLDDAARTPVFGV